MSPEEMDTTLWWVKDAAGILDQNGSDTHAEHCRNAADLITSLRTALASAKKERDEARIWHEKAHGFLRELQNVKAVLASAESRATEAEKLARGLLHWADAQCPCHNEEPNPCPLCGASVENLDACKAAENKVPPKLLEQARAVLSRIAKEKPHG